MLVATLVCTSGCQPERFNRELIGEDGLRTVRVLYSGANEQIFGPVWDDTPKFLIFEPLVTYEANTCSDIVGGLAARWDAAPDWKIWTVELRPDVHWHDGVPVTSADVAFTVALWKHPDVLFNGAVPVDSIEILDSLRFRVFLKRPSDWPVDGWDIIYPAHLLRDLDPADFSEWEFWTRPVGNGPFRYVRHVPGTVVELEANPDYYLGRPSLDGVLIQFKTGGRSQSGVVELMAGNVDIVAGLSGVDAQALAEDPRLNAFFVYQAMTTWLIWNFTDPHFSDVRVRRALALGTDRSGLHRALGFPDGVPVTDGVFFMCEPQNIQAPPPYLYDPQRADELLTEAGWHDSDGDGVLDRGGESFTFTLLLDSRAITAAVFVQDQLRRIGIDMKLEPLEWSVISARFESGDFEAIIAHTVTPELDAVAMDSPLGLLDRELALTLTAAETEPDLDRRLQLWEIAGQRYRDLAPALFLHPRLRVLVADRRIKGFGEPGTIVRRMAWRHAFGGLEHLWIADDAPAQR